MPEAPAFDLMIATSWLAPGDGESRQGEAIRRAVAAGADWGAYLRLVKRHRIPVFAREALRRTPGLEPPQGVLEKLERKSREARNQALLFAGLLAAILEAFARAGLPVLPLKGPLLSLELYGDLTLRQAKDLDLMVVREDLPRARTVLEGLGWVLVDPEGPLTPRQWQAFLAHEHHLDYRHGRLGMHLELHWAQPEDQPFWARCTRATWQGAPHLAMDPVDQLLFLCTHGARHAWFRAKWLGDLARIRALDQLDWEAALGSAQASRQAPALLQGLALVERLHGPARPPYPARVWQGLSPRLVNHPLKVLADPREPWDRGPGASLGERLAAIPYEAALQRHRNLRAQFRDLLYCREDFRILPLPDAWFGAYGFLRPFLWAWRILIRARPKRRGPAGSPPGPPPGAGPAAP